MAYLERVPEAWPAAKFIEPAVEHDAGAPPVVGEGTGVVCFYFR